MIFLCITGAFQPSIHALAWPLALAVCFSRSAVAWSQRFDTAEGPTPPGHAVAARPPGPVGARPERPERSKLRQNKVVEKSSSAKVLGGWLYIYIIIYIYDVSDVYLIWLLCGNYLSDRVLQMKQGLKSTQSDL